MKHYLPLLALLACICTRGRAQILVANIEQANAGSDPISLQSDDQHLIFFAETEAEGDELYLVNENGEAERFAVAIPGRRTFQNPNARLIDGSVYFVLYQDATDRVAYYRADLEEETMNVFASLPGGVNLPDPVFTDAGDGRVAFVHRDDDYTFELYLYDTNGDELTMLATLPDNRFPAGIDFLDDERIVVVYPYEVGGDNPLLVSDGTPEGTFAFYPEPGFSYLEPRVALADGGFVLTGLGPLREHNGYYYVDSSLQEYIPLHQVISLPDTIISNLARHKDSLYFTSRDEAHRTFLWRADLSFQNITQVAILADGTERATVGDILFRDDLIFYRLFRPDGTRLLARTDGTPAGTFSLTTFAKTGTVNSSDLGRPVRMAGNGLYYFLGLDEESGRIELFRTDGSVTGTRRVSQLGEALNEPYDRHLVASRDAVYFVAKDPDKGREVFRSDGTRAGTRVLADLETREESSFARPLTVYNDQLLFTAGTNCNGREIYQTSGTAVTTELVTDLNPGANGTGVYSFVEVNGDLYFSADLENRRDQPIHRISSENGEVVVLPVDTATASPTILTRGTISPLGRLGEETLLLQGFMADVGQAVYTYHTGTGALRRLEIEETLRGINGSGLDFINVADSVVVFVLTTEEADTELWRTDGTDAGTYRLTTTESDPGWRSAIQSLTAIDGIAYFSVDPGSSRSRNTIWRTDGSREGTYALSETDAFDRAGGYFAYGGGVYFVGSNLGEHTFYSLGEQAYDIRRASFAEGLETFDDIESVRVAGNRLVFSASTLATGYELWGTDDSDRPIRLLADFRPGVENGFPRDMYAFDDSTLYFSAETEDTGRELWTTDGTEEGTYLVADIQPGEASSQPSNFLRYGNFVYFSATGGEEGTELWKYSPTDLDNDGYTGADDADETDPTVNAGSFGDPDMVAVSCPATDSTTSSHTLTDGPLEVLTYPNPVAETLRVSFSAGQKNLTLYNAAGAAVYHSREAGTMHAIPVRHLPSGNYHLFVSEPLLGRSSRHSIVIAH